MDTDTVLRVRLSDLYNDLNAMREAVENYGQIDDPIPQLDALADSTWWIADYLGITLTPPDGEEDDEDDEDDDE